MHNITHTATFEQSGKKAWVGEVNRLGLEEGHLHQGHFTHVIFAKQVL